MMKWVRSEHLLLIPGGLLTISLIGPPLTLSAGSSHMHTSSEPTSPSLTRKFTLSPILSTILISNLYVSSLAHFADIPSHPTPFT